MLISNGMPTGCAFNLLFVVAVVKDLTLGAQIVIGHQLGGDLGVAHGLTDLAAYEISQGAVGLLIGQEVGIAAEKEVEAALLPQLLVERLALFRGVLGAQARGHLERHTHGMRVHRRPDGVPVFASVRDPKIAAKLVPR